MSGGLSILHISDLHYSKNHSTDLELLIEPLLVDIEAMVLKYQRPDCIIFSGDLVQNPDEPDAYLAVLDFLDRLANIAGTPYNCIIVAPGNHDVSRAAITGNRLEHDAIFAHARDQNYIETLYAKGQLMDYARKIGRDFFATSNLFEQQWIDPFVCTVSIPDRHLSILAINSTLCCTAAGSETDLGNLAIPITAVDRALSAIPNSHLVMSVCHHPFSHLTEGTGRNLRTALSHRSRAHFFGHLHDPLPQYVITPGGETMSLQAGALYVKPSTFLGYSVLRVTDRGEHPQVVSRWYMEGRRVFDDATNVCAHGVFYPNAAAQAYWDSQLPKINKTIFGKWLREEAYIELKKEHNTTFNGMPLEDIFVFPPLARSNRGVEDASVEGSAQAEEIWSIVDVLERPENILILVPNESGATSLLSFLALQQSKGGPRQSTPRIPLLVDIRGIRPYPAQALRALRQAHPQVDHENYGWRRLAHLHPYLVLVDNFDPENQDHGTALALLHTTVPNAKFIIATRTNLSAPEKISIDFKLSFSYLLLNLLPFGRRKVRDLVRKWTLPPAYPENHVVEQILDRFRALNIPLTGPHISMFLMVLAEQKNFSPINQSTVIENFVERLLEKPNPEKIFRKAIDFKEKAEVLSIFAEHLVRRDAGAIALLELTNFISSYYEGIGIRRNVLELINTLKDESVLEEFDGNVTFRYNVLFSFFVAYRMLRSDEFKAYIFDYDRFTSFVHEIDLYCGLSRQDLWALETVAAHYEKLTAEAPSEIRSLSDYIALERLVLPQVEDFDEFVKRFSQTVIEEMPREEKDKLLDGPQRSAAEFRQSLARRTNYKGAIKWLFALRVYSVCLKNLEAINKEAKKKHLRAVLDGWARVVGFIVALVGAGIEDRTVEAGGMRFRFDGFKQLDGSFMRMIVTGVPSFIAGYMRSDLGTQKLELQLEDADLEKPAVINLLRTGLITFLKLPQFLRHIRAYFERSASSLFLKEVMGLKLREFYLRYGFTHEESLELRRIMAGVDADIRGLRGEERDRHIGRMLQSMEKSKIVKETKF